MDGGQPGGLNSCSPDGAQRNPGTISLLAEAPLPDRGTAKWRSLYPGYEALVWTQTIFPARSVKQSNITITMR